MAPGDAIAGFERGNVSFLTCIGVLEKSILEEAPRLQNHIRRRSREHGDGDITNQEYQAEIFGLYEVLCQ